MNLEFCETDQHKILPEKFSETAEALFLDFKTYEEIKTIAFNFKYFDSEVTRIPFHELAHRYCKLPKEKVIGTFCPSGTRSTMAYLYLLFWGFEKVKWIDGNYEQITPLQKPVVLFNKSYKK